ncbi:FtsW/RodA/SpoVE family cell cycle protein [Pseudonocardia kujensis]|uniref:FtsW/RodA/SpoVE family cell cycle protein n=1 Tax=Pseudonocardia kujensis TaxID=1128675 RepID=UPI001E377C51|nr:FtsW/RodA/SpoVE family cell cycle protein [Pseudonocardia kujensis]MCE0768495.1 FtsW/RodA/SpoVE family cell cycle protein [Pseudonocardia kujensis]
MVQDVPAEVPAPADHTVVPVRRLRVIELVLVILACAVVTLALVLVEVGQNQQLSAQVLLLAPGYLALIVLAHLVVRATAPFADPLVLPLVALLNGLGLVMIHRLDLAAAATAAAAGSPAPSADAVRQLVWTAAGVLLLALLCWRLRDHRVLARYAYTLGLAGLALLALPGLLPARLSEINGAKLWLRLGPFSIQPGEFAKIFVIVFVAAFLVSKRELFRTAGRTVGPVVLPRLRDLAPLLVAWGLAVGVLTLERELGASMLIFGVVLVMIYVATSRISWVLIGLLCFAASSVAAYELFDHVRTRFEVWLDPTAEYTGSGYQVSQSLFGLGTGGTFGTGLGQGRPDLVPLANADFIGSGIGEELGLVGISAVLLVYALLAARAFRTALRLRDGFGTLLAAGLGATIGLQVFIVIGGVTNLIPETGLTTPFLSYGGSSLLANYLLLGLLLRLSHHANLPPTPQRRPLAPLDRAATQVVARPSDPSRR